MNFFATFINLFLTALSLAILARVIMSWVTMFAPDSPIVKTINDMLNQMTEPVLGTVATGDSSVGHVRPHADDCPDPASGHTGLLGSGPAILVFA